MALHYVYMNVYGRVMPKASVALAATTLLFLSACASEQTEPSAPPSDAPLSESSSGASSSGSPHALRSADSPQEAARTTQREDQQENLCTLDQLDISLHQGEGAAGKQYYDLEFTNSSDNDCHMRGYPGVSLVGQGTQIGEAAERPEQDSVQPNHTLAHGESITYTLSLTRAALYGCETTDAEGFRVYPPEETRSVVLDEQGLEGCMGNQSLLRITDAAKR